MMLNLVQQSSCDNKTNTIPVKKKKNEWINKMLILIDVKKNSEFN